MARPPLAYLKLRDCRLLCQGLMIPPMVILEQLRHYVSGSWALVSGTLSRRSSVAARRPSGPWPVVEFVPVAGSQELPSAGAKWCFCRGCGPEALSSPRVNSFCAWFVPSSGGTTSVGAVSSCSLTLCPLITGMVIVVPGSEGRPPSTRIVVSRWSGGEILNCNSSFAY